MDAICDLQYILDIEIHTGTADPNKKDEENRNQTSKVGKTFLQWAQNQPRLLMDIPSTGAPNACCLSVLLPT